MEEIPKKREEIEITTTRPLASVEIYCFSLS
jgi:hypothetical protein